jgi:hypothetical protein
VRINGENPAKDFQPCPGTLGEVHFPTDMDGVRADTWIENGTEVSPYYDSLLGKLMVFAPTRQAAVEKMQAALAATRIKGVPNNLEFLRTMVQDPRFVKGDTTTKFLEGFHFMPRVIEVVLPGLQTSVQDWPGRTKLWHVGVPPSGPMDSLSHRLANALVGNDSEAAALEFGLTGPTLKFHANCLVALTGERGGRGCGWRGSGSREKQNGHGVDRFNLMTCGSAEGGTLLYSSSCMQDQLLLHPLNPCYLHATCDTSCCPPCLLQVLGLRPHWMAPQCPGGPASLWRPARSWSSARCSLTAG